MRINIIPTIIALLFAALLCYVFICFDATVLLTAVAGTIAALLLVSAMATDFDTGRNHTVLFRTVSAVLLAVSLLVNALLAYTSAGTATVVIPNTVIVLVWLLCLNGALKRKKTER